MIQNILIYGGIGLNIVGAIFLMAYAMKYFYAFRQAENQPIKKNEMMPDWRKKRAIGFGLMILGAIIVVIGCIV